MRKLILILLLPMAACKIDTASVDDGVEIEPSPVESASYECSAQVNGIDIYADYTITYDPNSNTTFESLQCEVAQNGHTINVASSSLGICQMNVGNIEWVTVTFSNNVAYWQYRDANFNQTGGYLACQTAQ